MNDQWYEYFARAISDLTRTMPDADARTIVTKAKAIANAATNATRDLHEEPVVHFARILGHLVAKPDGPDTEEALREALGIWIRVYFPAAITAAIDHNEIERNGDKLITPMPF